MAKHKKILSKISLNRLQEITVSWCKKCIIHKRYKLIISLKRDSQALQNCKEIDNRK